MGSSSTHKKKSGQQSARQVIDSLLTHRINTLTELCRAERFAAAAETAEEAQAFQQPMTSAWDYYVSSNQMLTELRGLTPSYPFSGDVYAYAQELVRNDPKANRSWNFAWLVLQKIVDENLISTYAEIEANKPEMWTGMQPTSEQIQQLANCFMYEWSNAVQRMLQHWQVPPVWC
ncbi:hypothetical protein QBC38DRAFT_38595 [Podospora fimiseda]|uniref:Uncharacterized protein n=1 Tax=Podospora fimiseda TaxID=252190 RepID=A0AAN7BIA5_9PEZI|nr:hypothetical protein QBC38DRAFT_38595 [Podospora fimiseda]